MTSNRAISAADSFDARLADADFQNEWERYALARAVALEVTRYRVDHNLSQTALARMLGMQQPAIARLEAGDHNPSVETLMRLSRGLGIDLHIDITPEHVGVKLSA
ncbi:MAG TPA: helix-turn-helix transcriptional regulator [Acidimicrobiales bacterium]